MLVITVQLDLENSPNSLKSSVIGTMKDHQGFNGSMTNGTRRIFQLLPICLHQATELLRQGDSTAEMASNANTQYCTLWVQEELCEIMVNAQCWMQGDFGYRHTGCYCTLQYDLSSMKIVSSKVRVAGLVCSKPASFGSFPRTSESFFGGYNAEHRRSTAVGQT